jgi:hypothetical protein
MIRRAELAIIIANCFYAHGATSITILALLRVKIADSGQ